MFTWMLILHLQILCFLRVNGQDPLTAIPDVVLLDEKFVEELPVGHVILNLDKAISLYDERQRGNTSHYMQSISRTFSLVPSEQSDYFRVTSRADLLIMKRIDRESVCKQTSFESPWMGKSNDKGERVCTMKVSLNALELSKNGQESRRRLRPVLVRFVVEDINDNRPICHPPSTAINDDHFSLPTIEVLEKADLSDILATWVVSDEDTCENGMYGFSQISNSNNNEDDQFVLDIADSTFAKFPSSKITLQLRLKKTFKIKHQAKRSTNLIDEFIIKYVVWDNRDATGQGHSTSHKSHRTVCNLRVHVLDENDHSPEWVRPEEFRFNRPVKLDIKESNIGRNSDLLKLEATDSDAGSNARIRYSMIASSSTSSSSTEQSEETVLLNSFLHLDPNTGVLRVRRFPLDYETLSRQLHLTKTNHNGSEAVGIHLFVKAVDSPKEESLQRSSPLGELFIWVHDANDNPPKITVLGIIPNPPATSVFTENTIVVRENLPALEPIATVNVEDPDTGAGGRVACELIEYSRTSGGHLPVRENASFHLVKTAFPNMEMSNHNFGYQILTATSLDREVQASFELRLVCADGAKLMEDKLHTYQRNKDRLTSVVNIFVQVLDTNDNPPIASPSGNQFLDNTIKRVVKCEIVENAKPNTRICQLQAFDADEGKNAAIEWQLGEDAPSWVKMDSTSGWLLATTGRSGPDRETASQHNFTVIVRDGVGISRQNSLSSIIPVALTVLDINDHQPEITPFFYFSISESAPAGTVVCRLNATDMDEPGSENAAISYIIAGVRSFDSKHPAYDMSERERNTWSTSKLNGGILNSPFELDAETGVITVGSRGLDRELKETYELLIEVVDGGSPIRNSQISQNTANNNNWRPSKIRLTAQTTVQINVFDENDSTPKFINPKNGVGTVTLTCADILLLPKVIFKVMANDSDKGPNAEMEYSLRFNKDAETTAVLTSVIQSGNKSFTKSNQITERDPELPLFDIEPRSGELSLVDVSSLSLRCQNTVTTVDHRGMSPTASRELGKYNLIITVTDKGSIQLSATAQIFIRIITTDLESSDRPQTSIQGRSRSVQQYTPETHSRFDSVVSSSSSFSSPSDMSGGHWSDIKGSPEVHLPASDRYSFFSSPTAFWSATICLAVATAVLLGLICTFVLMAFKRKKPMDDREHQVGDMYPQVPSTCLSLDGNLPTTCDSKSLRLAYPENATAKKVRMCYAGPDNSFYDWPPVKYEPGKKAGVIGQPSHLNAEDMNAVGSTYQYGLLRLRDGQIPTEIVLNGLEVYQPLIASPQKQHSCNTNHHNQSATLYHHNQSGLTLRPNDMRIQLMNSEISSPVPTTTSSLLRQEDAKILTHQEDSMFIGLQLKKNKKAKITCPEQARLAKDDIELTVQRGADSGDLLLDSAQTRHLSRSSTTLQQMKFETSFV